MVRAGKPRPSLAVRVLTGHQRAARGPEDRLQLEVWVLPGGGSQTDRSSSESEWGECEEKNWVPDSGHFGYVGVKCHGQLLPQLICLLRT